MARHRVGPENASQKAYRTLSFCCESSDILCGSHGVILYACDGVVRPSSSATRAVKADQQVTRWALASSAGSYWGFIFYIVKDTFRRLPPGSYCKFGRDPLARVTWLRPGFSKATHVAKSRYLQASDFRGNSRTAKIVKSLNK